MYVCLCRERKREGVERERERVLTFCPLTATVKRGQEPYRIPLLFSNSSSRTFSFRAISSMLLWLEVGGHSGSGILAVA